jgi:hypothetical protein
MGARTHWQGPLRARTVCRGGGSVQEDTRQGAVISGTYGSLLEHIMAAQEGGVTGPSCTYIDGSGSIITASLVRPGQRQVTRPPTRRCDTMFQSSFAARSEVCIRFHSSGPRARYQRGIRQGHDSVPRSDKCRHSTLQWMVRLGQRVRANGQIRCGREALPGSSTHQSEQRHDSCAYRSGKLQTISIPRFC